MFDIMGEVFHIINFKISKFKPLNCETYVIPMQYVQIGELCTSLEEE